MRSEWPFLLRPARNCPDLHPNPELGRQRRLHRLGLDASARKLKLLLVSRLNADNLEAIRSLPAKIAIVAEAARKSRTRKKRLEQAWRNVVALRPNPVRTRRPPDPLRTTTALTRESSACF